MSGSGRVSGTVGPCSQSVWYSQPLWVLTSVENHCQVKYQSIWEKCGDACDLVSQEFLASLSVRLCFLLPASCDNLLRPNLFSCPLVNAVAALYETVTDVPESWVCWRADFLFGALYPKFFRGSLIIDLVSTVLHPDLPKVRWCWYLSPRNGCF